MVVSIQTFGSYVAKLHPHVHGLLSDGAFYKKGEYLQLPHFDARLVEEVFRRRVIELLHRAERPRRGQAKALEDRAAFRAWIAATIVMRLSYSPDGRAGQTAAHSEGRQPIAGLGGHRVMRRAFVYLLSIPVAFRIACKYKGRIDIGAGFPSGG